MKSMNYRIWLACTAALCATACERTLNLAWNDAGDDDAGSPPDQDAAPPLTMADGGVFLCGKKPCACANNLDDDDDGLIDGFDGECTGPHDEDEASFATGGPKGGNPNCRDCFFDRNAGPDEGCKIAARCTIDGTASGAPASCAQCDPAPACIDDCLPRTPNGCDCFGCCQIQGQSFNVLLVDSCSLDKVDDPASCPRCQLTLSECKNDCGRCELCPGKTADMLPIDCALGAGPGFTCDQGDVCGPDRACTGLAYCAQGCCVPVVL